MNEMDGETMRNTRVVIFLLIFMVSLVFNICIFDVSEATSNESSIPHNEVAITEDTFIGIWKDTPDGYAGNTHHFYEDGCYRYYYTEAWDALDPRCYLDGTWVLQGSTITISISSLLVREHGLLTYDKATGYDFEGYCLVVYNLEPNMGKHFDVSDLRIEKVEDEFFQLDDQLTVDFDGTQVWKYSDYPLFRTEEELDTQMGALEADLGDDGES